MRTFAPLPRIASVATAVPRHVLHQKDVAREAAHLFGASFADFARLSPVYENALIETRHSCVPLDWYMAPHSFTERNELYVQHALDLLVEAGESALSKAGIGWDAIDGLIIVSTSGIATPSLDARLIDRLRLRPETERLPVFGFGCAGGVLGLARAAQLARGAPEKRYLMIVVELCGLTFRFRDRSKSNLVATALFGDGAAAAVVSCSGPGPAVVGWGEHTWPQSLDVMGWDVSDDGLKVIFSRDIPALVRTEMRPVADRVLARHGLSIGDIDRFVCHPGGAKVLDALEDMLDLKRGDLVHSRSVLRRYGNMSAATALFVLEASLNEGGACRTLMSTLGPGFTAGFVILDHEVGAR